MIAQPASNFVRASQANREVVLDVRNLRIHYETPKGDVIAVNGISFQVYKGEIVGLVGESGCGKTTAAMGILQLVPSPGRILAGEILINGLDMLGLTGEELRERRWRELSLIPQGAMNSLNPVMRVRDQIGDAIITHEGQQPKDKLKARILELFALVGLPPRVYDLYPHELSGGMKQRACIAMAIALSPPVIIADEPTSALDVVVQRVVAQTLLDVKERLGVSMIMIGHDMGLQAQMVDRIIVMYAGNIVEVTPVFPAFHNPLHPYTQLLISSIPSIRERKPLKITTGLTHDLRNPPPGCSFQLRCPHVMDICKKTQPAMIEREPEHRVACYLYGKEEAKG
ncbi:MAG: ABC transporter ATP-binding protein [Chloroflexi bacterium]|nr:ABC transporter ATP-binding protein [Chloroflexota bacterium]